MWPVHSPLLGISWRIASRNGMAHSGRLSGRGLTIALAFSHLPATNCMRRALFRLQLRSLQNGMVLRGPRSVAVLACPILLTSSVHLWAAAGIYMLVATSWLRTARRQTTLRNGMGRLGPLWEPRPIWELTVWRFLVRFSTRRM